MIKIKASAKSKASVKIQALAAIIAIAAAVALPQLCHLAGNALGVHSAIGEVLLPMHLPIILAAILAGPYAGLAAGALSPIISFYLTAMPKASLLPFMVLELACYGLFAGLLRERRLPVAAKVLIAQIAGRLIRAIAIIAAFYLFEGSVAPAVIFTSIIAGLPGIALQLILIPLTVKAVNSLSRYER